MAMGASPPPPPTNGNKGIINRGIDVIVGVDTWKRAFILLLFGVAALVGTMIYQHPEWIETALKSDDEEEVKLVDVATISADLPKLRAAVGADLVVVFATVVGRNEQWMVAYDATPEIREVIEREAKDRWSYSRPFLADESPWNPIVIEILNGNTGCYDINEAFVKLRLVQPLHAVCVVGIPPGPQALVGWMGAGYTHPIDRPEGQQIRAALRSQAIEWAE